MQVPAYYDQIVGDLYLAPEGAALAKGGVDTLQEGGGDERAAAAGAESCGVPASPQPLASFTRSNCGWMVNVSLPEAATQFGYRIGDKGEFTDAGLLDVLDQRTGTRMPKTYFEMAPDQGKTTIYVTWRDKRGEQADIVPINFDPTAALADEQKKMLEQFWTSWIAFRDFNGMLGLFHPPRDLSLRDQGGALRARRRSGRTRCSSCRPAIRQTRIACPENATLYMKVPPKTASMQVQLTYVDGSQSADADLQRARNSREFSGQTTLIFQSIGIDAYMALITATNERR